ncbi:MAG: glycoside hydrolase family 127 protein [Anaerolineales bacterium]|nr:glycoside hydrolase family 127 protein [Anaerolineales bacterium]
MLISQVAISDPFWSPRLETNAKVSILHQWRELEASRCIDNFRIAAGLKKGFRKGWFFADSDAYKWLDAAARIYGDWPSNDLKASMDALISLLARAQMEDGYLYTYNQIHFPGERWGNLMIEHELYCLGHLIEAAVSHFQATGDPSALNLARKAADLLVRDFLTATAEKTSGHEEIEIALLRLYLVTRHTPYRDLAKQFLERRGRVRPFAPLILRQNSRVEKRRKIVREQRRAFLAGNPDQQSFQLPPENYAKRPFSAKWRWFLSVLNGKYFQQHAPIRSQNVPVGHAVRFGYLETAIAMLHRIEPDPTLLPAMEQAWEHMVLHRMYVTGGIGSLPESEGFGRDGELDPEVAYAETCAALAGLFWNWEMALIHAEAKFSDLFEWQLYNAAAVGIGLGGDSYLYNNPLLCRKGITRRPWFQVPCCPSNLSRTWAALGKYIYSYDQDDLWIHQYIGNELRMADGKWKTVSLESSLPWEGKIRIAFQPDRPVNFTLHVRIPSWAGNTSLKVNGSSVDVPVNKNIPLPPPASGYDPRLSSYIALPRCWSPDDTVDLEFEIPIVRRKAAPHLRGCKNKVALSRGPLVYCLESTDNPGMDIFTARINPETIHVERDQNLLGGVQVLRGKTRDGMDFTAIPYPLWANRNESQMTVWVNT